MAQLYFPHFLKKEQVLGIGARISRFYIINSEFVKRFYYLYLIGNRK